ncbi:uncharacterized protein [Halyomorpha halys]|uniref:uncharacterized protein n=1 Tax=Halyomorpha halys TaxID=286706 RepID=UPI0006D511AC|nr:uncharacterized protein LOC106689076 [Halyomorpha halys]
MASTTQLLLFLLTAGVIVTTLAHEIPIRKIEEFQGLPEDSGTPLLSKPSRSLVSGVPHFSPPISVDTLYSIDPSITNGPSSGEESPHIRNRRGGGKYRNRPVGSRKKSKRVGGGSFNDENNSSAFGDKTRPHVYGVSGSNIRISHRREDSFERRSGRGSNVTKKPSLSQRSNDYLQFRKADSVGHKYDRRINRRNQDSMGWSVISNESQ